MALKGYYPSEPFSLMISLKYGAYLVALEVWKFDFHQLVFKRCPKQKGYQISVKNWIFDDSSQVFLLRQLWIDNYCVKS